MNVFSKFVIWSVIGFWCLSLGISAQQKTPKAVDKNLLKAMQWRNIGPYRGGRSVAVAGHPAQPNVYYFGCEGGGVWKSDDGGITWLNVSDGFFKNGSVGAIAVAESDPNVVYVGMGESFIRGNVTYGDGVYKSSDAGKTWTNVGLKETQFIGRVAINPVNSDIVYVAALGQVFGTNKERGVYRSMDGGKTWKNVLFKDEKTGAVDIVIDPMNPRNIYATFWECNRNAWSMSSGGPGSGLYKSTDGGDTWEELTKNPGLPKGVVGKIGVAASPVKADLVWAIVENENGGVFRSDDGGKTWQRTNENRNLRQRAWYYTRIYADTRNSESVYVLNVQFHKSVDGGKSFSMIDTKHGDHHDMWIDPHNAERMIIGDDGGAAVSYNSGKSWSDLDQPTAQFYHVTLDNQFPYHVYGAQQDNSTIEIAGRTSSYGVDFNDWHPVAGGESGYIAVHPEKPWITFGGSYGGYLTKLNYNTRQEQNVSIWPDSPIGSGAGDNKYRFQWTYPIVFSPHDAHVLYACGNVVFRSTNEGAGWEAISPDLTRNDTAKQKASGGPITKDNTSVEYYNTIFTFEESPKAKGTLWSGSDDGLVHVSRNNGASWQNVSPAGFGEGLISIIEPSHFEAGTAYVAATKYKFNDYQPYLFKTTDYGKSWKRINEGIPAGAFTRVIRDDPNKQGLLYAGTELGVYVSFNDGDSWQPLQLNLPIVPIHDLAVHARDMDLVAATHGRAFWILDDLTPLHQLTDELAKKEVLLFKPRFAYRMDGFQYSEPGIPLGTNAPNGVLVNYYFIDKPRDESKLEFLDGDGKIIAAYSSKKDKKGKVIEESKEFYEKPKETRMGTVPADTGMNRFVWDMRYADAVEVPGAIIWGGDHRGPKVVPGIYQVRLTAGKFSEIQAFEIKEDPRVEATADDLKVQFELLRKMHEKFNETNKAINQIREVNKQIGDFLSKIKDTTMAKPVKLAAKPLQDSLSAIENVLMQTKAKSSQDVLNYPIKLNNKLASLISDVASADARPTAQQVEVYEVLSSKIDVQLKKLKPLMEQSLPAFNETVRLQSVPAVMPEKDK